MDTAVRRLQQVQYFLNDRRHILDLPSGERVFVHSPPDADSAATIFVNEDPILGYRMLKPAMDAGLVLSAVGTAFENSEKDPTKKYPVLELLPVLTEKRKEGEKIENVDVWAAVYTLWTLLHAQEVIPIMFSASYPTYIREAMMEYLIYSGLARRALPSTNASTSTFSSSIGNAALASTQHDLIFLLRGAFWQGGGQGPAFSNTVRSWLQHPLDHVPFPASPSFTRSPTVIAAHPLRSPKPPRGALVYSRYCTPVGKTLTMHVLDLEDEREDGDMAAFHRWMNDERVGKGWGEQGDMEKHKRYVIGVERDPHVLALVMSWDGERMGYAEINWIRENHLAPYVPDGAHDYDRGLHVLVGEDKFRGQTYSQAWFRCVTHYIFLSDARTMRIIGEPKRNNPAIIKTSVDAGMHLQTFFYFPYKYSAMTMNLRERFFKEDMLS